MDSSKLAVPFRQLTGREPFYIVWNGASGQQNAELVRDTIVRVLGEAGRRYHLFVLSAGGSLAELAGRALASARREGGVVVACGGDGTISAVARAVLGTGVPFGALPQGTFNYFGRSHGISQDIEQALFGLLDARVQPVQVGLLNGQAFLVNASVGLYPQLLEDREAYKRRYGRSRLVAFWSGILSMFHVHRRLALRIEVEGRTHLLRTPTLVVGNNMLQLRRIGIAEAGELERGRLVAMTVKPIGVLAGYLLLLRGVISRLGDAENVISFGFERMTVRMGRHRRTIKVAMDGEVHTMAGPLEFRVAPNALPLLVPMAGGGGRVVQ